MQNRCWQVDPLGSHYEPGRVARKKKERETPLLVDVCLLCPKPGLLECNLPIATCNSSHATHEPCKRANLGLSHLQALNSSRPEREFANKSSLYHAISTLARAQPYQATEPQSHVFLVFRRSSRGYQGFAFQVHITRVDPRRQIRTTAPRASAHGGRALRQAMAGMDSEALFKARAIDIGIAEPLLQSFLDANITSFSRLAFISSYQPGQADDTPLVTAANRVAGRDLEPGEMAAVRHLFFEASAMAVAELKQRVERVDTAEPQRLPLAERVARLERQRERLQGISINIYSEPSYKLVDGH